MDDADAKRFLLEQIETVPHLEALLLIWNSRPRLWSIEELAARLYVSPNLARDAAKDLRSRGLLELDPTSQRYRYRSGAEEKDRLVELVDSTYRRRFIPISNLIHSKGSPAVRAFARAFRLRKGRE